MTTFNSALFVINEVYADEYVKQRMTPLEVVKALAKAGMLMPDHPEPGHDKWAGTGNGDVHIRWAVDDMHLTPNEARALGLDLLAAADEAEGNSHEL